MTKFQSHDDIGFKRVSSQLRRWIEEINNPSGRFIERNLAGITTDWCTNGCLHPAGMTLEIQTGKTF